MSDRKKQPQTPRDGREVSGGKRRIKPEHIACIVVGVLAAVAVALLIVIFAAGPSSGGWLPVLPCCR